MRVSGAAKRGAWFTGWLLTALIAPAEIIDRIAVTVGNQVITEAQILEEIRVTAFLNRTPVEMNLEQKRKAAERLVEQTLMRSDMEFSHFPLPAPDESAELEGEIRSRYASDQEFQKALASYGISLEVLRQHLWWQVTMLRFIEFRFRPGVEISDAEIRQYYDQKLEEWRKQPGAKIPTLEESRTEIEKILTDQRVDQAVDRWLGDARTRVAILYHKEAFE